MRALPTVTSTPARLLARLKVGTKLMLLVLLPVCVLLGFTIVTAVGDYRFASQLGSYQTSTQVSFATAGLADRLEEELTATVLAGVRPGAPAQAGLSAAQRDTNDAFRHAEVSAAGFPGTLDVPGRLDAARRQLAALRLQVSAGPLSAAEVSDSYSVIVDDLINTVGDLIEGRPTQASGRAADAYLAILQAIEAAGRERAEVAAVIAAAGTDPTAAASRWATLESAELDAFRANATSELTANLEAVLFSSAGIAVQQVRNAFLANPRATVAHTSLATWLGVSGTRIDGLRSLESGAGGVLAATASQDLHSARTSGLRDLGLSLAVLVTVAAFGLALRQSITRPLREVSRGARTLSRGDLTFDVSYAGRDEIGDVAAAFRDLRVTVERLAGQIRETTAAIRHNRLDHRADISSFDGTWAQILAGMNDTTAAFATLHRRRRRAEGELEGIFNLSLDLLCIADRDGFFKRVNPAFERTLGYTSTELVSRPYAEFVHPDDRAPTQEAQDNLVRGGDVVRFENRYIRRDGAVRWLQWNARGVPEEGLIYAAARDVSESRRASEEQAALRRVATLVAKGASPEAVFNAVVAEMHMLLAADSTRLLRYEPGNMVSVLAVRNDPDAQAPSARHYSLDGDSVSGAVWRSGRSVRFDSFSGPPGSVAEVLRRLGVTSAVGAPILVEGRLWGAIVAGWKRQHPSGGIEDRIAQFTELVATAISNAQARADLAASRARVVAAGDETRRRIERDLHDGAQQRLVSLGLALRAAQEAIPPDQAEVRSDLDSVASGLGDALEELRELSSGIHPASLSLGGLGPAVKALARRSAVPVDLEVPQARLPERVEVAAYYVISEALTNAAKHAHAATARVRVELQGDVLKVQIRDDGVGGADPSKGSGLVGLTDRVESLGGKLDICSHPGEGTQVQADLPISV